MKPFSTCLLAAALLSATTASAQTTLRIGLRGGASRTTSTLAAASNSDTSQPSFISYNADKSGLYSWQAGVVMEASFGKLAFQPAVVFSQKGEVFHTSVILDGIVRTVSERTTTTRSNWLEVPLNVVYTLHGDHGLQVFAGPYVALAVGGHQAGTTVSGGTGVVGQTYGSFDGAVAYGSDTHNRRLDAGLNFGLGYRQGPVQVQLGYGLGLRDLHQATPNPSLIDPGFSPLYHDFGGDAAHSRVLQLTGTYFFSL